jgi:uncharacterized protein (DUF486 family)
MESKSFGTPNILVRNVLRYFYLRGCIHFHAMQISTSSSHSTNVDWAIRCFETCLVIPADTYASDISVAAFKKLVLVSCYKHTMDEKSLYQSTFHKSSIVVEPSFTRKKSGSGKFKRFPKANSDDIDRLSTDSGSRNSLLPAPLSLPNGMSPAMHKLLSKSISGERTSPASSSDQIQQHLPRHSEQPTSANVMNVESLDEDEAEETETALVADDIDINSSHGQKLQQHQQPVKHKKKTPIHDSVKFYYDLSRAFVTADRALFLSILIQNEAIWKEDCNFNFIQNQLNKTAMIHRQVLLISTIISDISLQDLQKGLHLDSIAEVKSVLQFLSKRYQWDIKIFDDSNISDTSMGEKNAFVTFPRFATSKLCEDSDISSATITQELIQLAYLVQMKDNEIGSSAHYNSILSSNYNALSTRGKKEKKGGGPRGVDEIY